MVTATATTHPFLFVDMPLITQILQKKDDLAAFDRYVTVLYHRNTSDPGDTRSIEQEVTPLVDEDHLDRERFVTYSMYTGMNSYFNNNSLSAAYGRAYVRAIVDQPVDFPEGVVTAESPEGMQAFDGTPSGKLYALGALYDWLFDQLDVSLRGTMREHILDLMDYIEGTWAYYSDPLPSGGHSRLANINALVALLAIQNEIGLDEDPLRDRYLHYLNLVVRNWEEGYNPLQNWISINGGYHMGWAYGTSYTSMIPYLAWEFAGGEGSWLGQAHDSRAYWYLYGLRHDRVSRSDSAAGHYDPFPYSGDVWGTAYTNDYKGLNLLVAAVMFDNPHAKWLFSRLDDSHVSYWELLYRHFGQDAGVPPTGLPLARHFRNAGYVIMRDSWDFGQNTLAVFKSTSFFSNNHHHRDQNAFTIYYKGPLAIDSGAYSAFGSYASKHWYNYYTRSVAHNTILIYDPNEEFGDSLHGKLSNDGGQARYVGKTDPETLEDVLEGGSNHLIGIDRFENRDHYAYARGDATLSYSSRKAKRVRRSIVYLRKHCYSHPVIVVYDHVLSQGREFEVAYLLHSIREPEVRDTQVTVTIDDGSDPDNQSHLVQQTLYPKDPVLRTVGGAENGRQFYVWDDGNGRPHNYDEGLSSDSTDHQRGLREAGEWRVEVCPRNQEQETRFLNVLSVMDGGNNYRPAQAVYVEGANLEGCFIGDDDGTEQTLVLFGNEVDSLDETLGLSGVPLFENLLVVGLHPETRYTVQVSESAVNIQEDAQGAFRSSPQGTLYLSDL